MVKVMEMLHYVTTEHGKAMGMLHYVTTEHAKVMEVGACYLMIWDSTRW